MKRTALVRLSTASLGTSLALLVGCAHARAGDGSTPPAPANPNSNAAMSADAATSAKATAAHSQTFATPELATSALQTAASNKDISALHTLFGVHCSDLFSGDDVQDANDFAAFGARMKEKTAVETTGADSAVVHLGNDGWPFPVPLKHSSDGWYFDTAAGIDEMTSRRIGEDELNTIDVCRAYVVAQREYFGTDWDGDGVVQYARRLHSSGDKKNGLYWPTTGNEVASPFGPLVAEATAEGYPDSDKLPRPYHGYKFHILTSQGAAAPGGAYNYVINGHMVAGFALIAMPADYGSSGIMTFIVNQNGTVYQKDLGEHTTEAVKSITEYNPDSSWTPVTGDEKR